MSWPTSSTTLAKALEDTDSEAINLRIDLVRLRSLITTADQQRRGIHSFIKRIQTALDIWDDAAAIQGIGQYVRDQKNDQSLDVAAEFSAMRAAAAALQAELFSSFPRHNPSGAVLFETDASDGTLTQLTFTVAQMAPLVPLIDAAIAQIDVT